MFARTFRPAASVLRSSVVRGKSTSSAIPVKELNSDHKSEIAAVSAIFIAFLGAGALVSNQTAFNISSARANQEL